MFGKLLRTWRARAAAIGVLGVLVGAAVFGQAALASGSNPKARSGHARSASAQNAKANGDLQAAADQAVADLVSNGTIDQHQASVIEAQVNSGSIDPAQLVAGGVVSQSQMAALANALAQVKQSFAARAGASQGSANTKSPSGQDARGSDNTKSPNGQDASGNGSLPAPVTAAIQGLVSNGTINQHQADVIESQIQTGAFDPDQLVASDVIDASQRSAVVNALAGVKRAAASQP